MSGPGVKRDELIYGSSLLDICPTVLSCYGLPVGEDMDGQVLVNGFAEERDIQYITSWDDITGNDGSHPAKERINTLESNAILQQLVALGYIDEPEENAEKAAEYAKRELHYNLAKSYMDAGLHGEGGRILEELWVQWPEEFRFAVELSHCYHAIGKAKESLELLENIFTAKKEKARKARDELEKLGRVIVNQGENENIQQELQATIQQLLQDSSQNPAGMHYLLGGACRAVGKLDQALEHFNLAEEEDGGFPALLVNKGSLYRELGQPLDAQQYYEKALSLDSEDYNAMLGLCGLKLADRQYTSAAHHALDCIALRYHTPMAHFYLGCALSRLGRLGDGIKALETALEQNPNFPDALRRLAFIYKNRLHLQDKARGYQKLAREAEERIEQLKKGALPKEERAETSIAKELQQLVSVPPADQENQIIIVSGIPRSGTSMMMQILDAGGLEVVNDDRRGRNDDNPKGYFEDERVKYLTKDSEWVADCCGKTLKVVAPLLPFLPDTTSLSYRVIFMERNLGEVIKSQAKMLKNMGRTNKRQPELLLRNGFFRQVEQSRALLTARGIPVLYVSYHDCISDPLKVIVGVDMFLGGGLNTEAMARVVDPSLWRNREVC
jgi:tetratricopeptide (TPR) repeat protein